MPTTRYNLKELLEQGVERELAVRRLTDMLPRNSAENKVLRDALAYIGPLDNVTHARAVLSGVAKNFSQREARALEQCEWAAETWALALGKIAVRELTTPTDMPLAGQPPPPPPVLVTVCQQSNLVATPSCPTTQQTSFPQGRQPTRLCNMSHPRGSQPGPQRVSVRLCAKTQQVATAQCPHTHTASFVKGTEPSRSCTWNHSPNIGQSVVVALCDRSNLRATSGCPNKHDQNFAQGSEPTQSCPVNHSAGPKLAVTLCDASNLVAGFGCGQTHQGFFAKGTEPTQICNIHSARTAAGKESWRGVIMGLAVIGVLVWVGVSALKGSGGNASGNVAPNGPPIVVPSPVRVTLCNDSQQVARTSGPDPCPATHVAEFTRGSEPQTLCSRDHTQTSAIPPPSTSVEKNICPVSNVLAGGGCPTAEVRSFTSGSEPTASCVKHPQPKLVSIECPSSARYGQPFSVSVTVENTGYPTRTGSVSVTSPDRSGISCTNGPPIKPENWEGRGEKIGLFDTSYPDDWNPDGSASNYGADAWTDAGWGTGRRRTLNFQVKPYNTGSIRLWIRFTLDLGKNNYSERSVRRARFYSAPSIRENSTGQKDEQNFPVEIRSVTVE